MPKVNYKWKLSDGYQTINNLKVFGTFICAGGSTMGYKLAGYYHLGGVEMLNHYAKMYQKNHNPKYLYIEDIRHFNTRQDLPDDLYDLDLLDGSPPCSSFSISGSREKEWGKVKKYENVNQKTDDLIFEYIKTVEKLKPKVFIMENVKGLIEGNARNYVINLSKKIKEAGYEHQIFLLNSATMGVPQIRQRVFFIGNRMNYNKLDLNFNEPPITFQEATMDYWSMGGESIENNSLFKHWQAIDYPNEISSKLRFNLYRPLLNKPCNTLIESCSNAGAASVCHPLYPRKLNKYESCVIQSFPLDYDFIDENPLSCIGRSVPPLMMYHISEQIKIQWLNR
jgi:DNA (cytosine-5)-methyltransferase 1